MQKDKATLLPHVFYLGIHTREILQMHICRKERVERADNPLLMSEKFSRKKKALSQRLIRNERGGGRWGDADGGMLLREWIQKESTFNEWGRG